MKALNSGVAFGFLTDAVAIHCHALTVMKRNLFLMPELLAEGSSILASRHARLKTDCAIVAKILDRFIVEKKRLERENQSTSIFFNPLKFFAIEETLHSRMLAFLLNPYAHHGQGNMFLIKFLQQLGVEAGGDCHWIVTAERGRVDIMIRRKNPHSVIVIENKSNWAVDQGHQLYRYWYHNIYRPCSRQGLDWRDAARYRVVYLAPSDAKNPEEQSLIKPDNLSGDDLPGKLSDIEGMVIHWTFDHDISRWLADCMDGLPQGNHRMREFLKQYSELWG